MFSNIKILFSAFILLLLIFMGYFIYSQKNSYNWDVELNTSNYEPYDLGLFYETLKAETGNDFVAIPARSSLLDNYKQMLAAHNSSYFYAGSQWFIGKAEAQFLRKYLSDGGTVFLSVPGISEYLSSVVPVLKTLTIHTQYSDSVNLLFKHSLYNTKQYGFTFLRKGEKVQQGWFSFSNSVSNEHVNYVSEIVGISAIMELPGNDCIRIKVGSGYLYLHCNPILFSNIYLTTNAGRNYLSNMLRHLPDGAVFYDHSSAVPKPNSLPIASSQSIVSFIYSNNALRVAWSLLLIGLLLFVFIGGRRRKVPHIPFIQVQNNSLKLVESLGYFYYAGRQSNQLVFKRELVYFNDYCKYNFRMVPISEYDFEELSLKSGVSIDIVKEIYKSIKKYEIFSELSNEELLQISSLINQFYTKHRNKYGE